MRSDAVSTYERRLSSRSGSLKIERQSSDGSCVCGSMESAVENVRQKFMVDGLKWDKSVLNCHLIKI
jgi:hypothetical protein